MCVCLCDRKGGRKTSAQQRLSDRQKLIRGEKKITLKID